MAVRRVTISFLAALAIAAGGCGLWVEEQAGTGEAGESAEAADAGAATEETPDPWAAVPGMVRAIEASVVAVRSGSGEGSGVIYDADGLVVTNDHVVTDPADTEVVLATGETLPAEVAATDPLTDLAVLRVDRDDLPAARFAGEVPPVGSLVVAAGNPLGFENTVTAGIVSGLGRSIPGPLEETRALVDLIQTDAAISPGNSGGALVEADGEVIGINVAYIPPTAGAVALGFAIPAPLVTEVVSELLATGRVSHPFIGVLPAPFSARTAERFGVETGGGVLVLRVVPGSPAADAGLRAGDIITSLAGEDVADVGGFISRLRDHDPGDTVTLGLWRGGQRMEVDVTLVERTPETETG